MHYRIVFPLVFVVVFSLASCRHTRELIYLKNMDDLEEHKGLPGETPEYRIKPNDNLYINIKSTNPEVTALFNPQAAGGYAAGTEQMYGQLTGQYLNGYQVDTDGNINLPIMGEFNVAGLTTIEVKKRVQERTDEYLRDAVVNVKLLSYKVTVLGEVRNPGIYYNYNTSLTIFEAVGMATGTTDFANIKTVLVIRPTEDGSESFRLNFRKKDMMLSEAFYLQPNDVVYVQPARFKSVQMNATTYSLFLSSVTAILAIVAITL
jgi:polysaccharide export outer membrane protein